VCLPLVMAGMRVILLLLESPRKRLLKAVVVQFDCHPEQAFFTQRGIWASRAKEPALSKRSAPKGRVLGDPIIARLARFFVKLHHYPEGNERWRNPA